MTWTSMRGWIPTVLLGVVLPLVTYALLERPLGEVAALLCAGAWPVLLGVGSAIIRRRIDEIALASLVLHLLGIVVALVLGDPRLVLLKNVAVTGLAGVVLLSTLLLSRPALFYMGRRFATDGFVAAAARWDGLWTYASFRRANRLMTAVWGAALLAEAAVRVALALWAPIPVTLAVGHILPTAVIVALVALTSVYGSRVRRANVPTGANDPITGEAMPPPDEPSTQNTTRPDTTAHQ